MSTQVLRRRGSTAAHSTFVGGTGELTVDSDKNTAVLHDGATVGGFVVAAPHLANIFSVTQTISPAANSSALVSSGSLTGANAQPVLDLSSLWNTAGAPIGIKLNITNTASGASALLLDLQRDGLSRMTVRKSGFQTLLRQEADVSASGIEISKRGTTGSATAALSNGSAVGAMLFRGYDGTAFGDAGSVRTFTTQAWAVGAHGTQLTFATVPIGSTTETTHATLNSTELAVTSRLLLPNTISATVGGVYFGGDRVFHNFGTNNIFAGVNAGNFTLSGASNTSLGVGSLLALTSGANNLAIGNSSLLSNTSGSQNVAVGASSMLLNTTGSNNTIVGFNAFAGISTGGFNTGIGSFVLAANTSGTLNTAIGASALGSNTTGSNNVAIGRAALNASVTSVQNVAIGESAGLLTTGVGGNIFIGHAAGNNATSGSVNIVIGYEVDLPSATASNLMTIGNLIFGTGIDGQGTTISSGNIGIAEAAPAARFVVGSGNTLLGHNILDNYGGRVDIRSAYATRAANVPTQLFVSTAALAQTIDTGGAIDLGGYVSTLARAFSYARIEGLASAGSGFGGYLSLKVLSLGGAMLEGLRINALGHSGFLLASPTARVHIAAGTPVASTAPLKFTTGTSLTATEAGAVEFTTDDLFFTITTGAARKRLLLADPTAGLTATRVPFATTNGRLTDAAGFTFAGTTLTLANLTMSTAGVLSITSGANQRAGNATLVGGTVTVANTTVTANTVVMLTRKTSGGTIGTAITYTVIAATSFTITSDSVLDTSTFSYMLVEVP